MANLDQDGAAMGQQVTSKEEMKRGLQMLPTEFQVLDDNVRRVSTQMTELRQTIAEKATVSDLDVAKKEISALSTGLERKADQAELQRNGAQLQAMSALLSSKADTASMEHLTQQFNALSSSMVTKGEVNALLPRLDQLADKVTALATSMRNKAEATDVEAFAMKLQFLNSSTSTMLKEGLEPLKRQLETVSAAVLQKADMTDVSQIQHQVKGLNENVSTKADASIVEQIHEKYRQTSTALLQKAEFTEVENLKPQIHLLRNLIEQKADHPEVDRLSVLLKGLTEGLTSTVEEKVEQKVRAILDVEQFSPQLQSLIEYRVAQKVESAVDSKLKSALEAEHQARMNELRLRLEKIQEDVDRRAMIDTIEGVTQKLNNALKLKADSTAIDALSAKVDKKVEQPAVDQRIAAAIDKEHNVWTGALKEAIDAEHKGWCGSKDQLQKQFTDGLKSKADMDGVKSKADISWVEVKADKSWVEGLVDTSKTQLSDALATKAEITWVQGLIDSVDKMVLRREPTNVVLTGMDGRVDDTNQRLLDLGSRFRALINALINVYMRDRQVGPVTRVGGGYSRYEDSYDPDFVEALKTLMTPDTSVSEGFGVGTPPLSPRGARVPASPSPNFSSPRLEDMRRELEQLAGVVETKAPNSRVERLALDVQKMSDTMMSQLVYPVRPQSARGPGHPPSTSRPAFRTVRFP